MTPHPDMPFERYLELLDAYGANFDRWPAQEFIAFKGYF